MHEPEIFNVVMATLNTEYLQALPAGTARFEIRMQDATAFRLAFVTGKVATPTAPYLAIPAGHLWEDICDPRRALTLYFAAPASGKVAEIQTWKGT